MKDRSAKNWTDIQIENGKTIVPNTTRITNHKAWNILQKKYLREFHV